MNYPGSRLTTAMIMMLSALIVSACSYVYVEPAQRFGPPATTAEITKHLSGNSSTSDSGGAFYAGNGDYKSYYYLPETLSEAPKVCTGSWRARDAKLVVKETCKSVSDGETVSIGPKTTLYAVYIDEHGALRLDEEREEPSTGKWTLGKPVEGFPNEADFTTMQTKIDAGKSVVTEGERLLIAAPFAIGYCALVGPMCLIM